MGVFLTLQIVVVGRIGNQEDWDDVHNGDNHSQKSKLIIVALIEDFESSGEQNDEDSQRGKGHCVYDIHYANSFNQALHLSGVPIVSEMSIYHIF